MISQSAAPHRLLCGGRGAGSLLPGAASEWVVGGAGVCKGDYRPEELRRWSLQGGVHGMPLRLMPGPRQQRGLGRRQEA